MSLPRRTVGLVLLALLVLGCSPRTATPARPTPSPDARLIGRGTIIDDGSGPRLCRGVLESYPPQCGGGPELVGLRWPALGVERAGGTTWGEFAVIGHYDGQRVVVVELVASGE